MSALHLRPRGFSELIDATFHIVRARFQALATSAALVMIPAMVTTMLMSAFAQEQAGTDGSGTQATVGGPVVMTTAEPPDWMYAALLPVFIVGFVVYTIGFGAMVYIASQAYLGRDAEIGPAFSHARRRFWSLVRATLTKYLLAMGLFVVMGALIAVALPGAASGSMGSAGAIGVVALLFPIAMVLGIILLLRWSMTTPVVINEDVGGGRALPRSAALTKGSKWRLFGIFLVLLVLFYVGMATLMFGGALVSGSLIVGQVIANLISLVMYPFAAALLAVVYYDLRIRNEGFDLELMAGGLQDSAALPAAPPTSRQPA